MRFMVRGFPVSEALTLPDPNSDRYDAPHLANLSTNVRGGVRVHSFPYGTEIPSGQVFEADSKSGKPPITSNSPGEPSEAPFFISELNKT